MLAAEGTRDFGIPGLKLETGDHICAFYLGPQERDEVMLPYMRAGLRAGDKILGIVDSPTTGEALASIGDASETGPYVESEQLELLSADQAYLRTGHFSTDDMLQFWADYVGAVMEGGRFAFTRASGEMSWAIRDLPDRSEFMRYEAALNDFIPRYPQSILCLYDLARFGGGIVVDALRTHPKLLLGGLVIENPHYTPPGQLIPAPS
jgi:hypothetical protein